MSNLTPFPYSGRRDNDPKHPVLDVLESYWRTLRLGTSAPARARIDPTAIDTALPWSFMLQEAGDGAARIRVAGQKLHDLMGMDPRGMMISALFNETSRETLSVMVQTSLEEPALVALPLIARGGLLRSDVEATILLLPLTDGKGQVTRILGALVADKMATLKGRKFDIAAELPVRVEPLSATTQFHPMQKGPDTDQRPTLRLVVNNG